MAVVKHLVIVLVKLDVQETVKLLVKQVVYYVIQDVSYVMAVG